MSDSSLYLLGLEIQCRVVELNEMSKSIEQFQDLYTEDNSESSRILVEETYSRYRKLIDQTRIQLEAYFHEERELGVPTDFLFRKLYRKVKATYD